MHWVALPLMALVVGQASSFKRANTAPPDLSDECGIAGLGDGCWSKWLDRDEPSGFGDDESLTSLRDDGLIPCSNPTAIECETIDGIAWDVFGQTMRTTCTTDGGLICANDDNPISLGRRLKIGDEGGAARVGRRLKILPGTAANGTVRQLQSLVPEPEPDPLPGATQQRVTCADYRTRYYCPAQDDCTPFGGMLTTLAQTVELPGSTIPTVSVCCPKECGGYCGAVACAEGPGGPDACCANTIATHAATCGSRVGAPCKMPDNDITCDPCVCDLDGIVNGIDTGRPGCAVYPDTGKTFAICAVTDGCQSLGALPILNMPGTAYRACVENEEPENNWFCTRAEGKWDTVLYNCTVDAGGTLRGAGCFANCSVTETNHKNIPVVGPTNQSHVSYIIEHSYGSVVAVRLRDAWLQSDCDLTDSVADVGDPERDVRPDGRFGTYNDPVARPDEQGCKHRFYGDEWNVSVVPQTPMSSEVTVRRVDADAGWAYDGLRVEYTVCGQDESGRVTQGQGLWRPSLGLLNPIDGRLQRDWDNCKFFRTGECSPAGPRLPGLDLSCTAQVREGWSGFCQCADGRQTYHVGCENHAPFRCSDACRVPEDWLCDPYRYDDGACDVACGSSDPDCSREVTVPWARIAQPSFTGQGPRRTRDSRGWS